MTERWTAALLLLVSLAVLARFVRGDRAQFQRFKELADTASRRRRYRRWTVRLWLFFLFPPLIGLALLGRLVAVTAPPAVFAPAAAHLPHLAPGDLQVMGAAVLVGLLGGMTAVAVVLLIAQRRGRTLRLWQIGDIDALLPRNRGEVGWGALMAVSAGVTEEVAFRLFLPLLIALVTGDAVVAFVGAALIFGAMHVYQGWVGVLATTILGAALSAAYLVSGALWVAMLLHALIDLNGLVFRPLLTGAWRRTAPTTAIAA